MLSASGSRRFVARQIPQQTLPNIQPARTLWDQRLGALPAGNCWHLPAHTSCSNRMLLLVASTSTHLREQLEQECVLGGEGHKVPHANVGNQEEPQGVKAGQAGLGGLGRLCRAAVCSCGVEHAAAAAAAAVGAEGGGQQRTRSRCEARSGSGCVHLYAHSMGSRSLKELWRRQAVLLRAVCTGVAPAGACAVAASGPAPVGSLPQAAHAAAALPLAWC